MQNPSHDNRAVDAFVDGCVTRHNLNAEQAVRLGERTSRAIDWIKSFRRAMGYVRRYGVQHRTARQRIAVTYHETRNLLGEFGAFTLNFGPAETSTADGFVLPPADGTDLESYTFFCLFRDGITSLTLQPGLLAVELESLLEVVAARGRREGDDAVTWLWSGRHPHVRLELEPTISPRVAAAMLARDDDDPMIEAFVRTLEAASPDRVLDPVEYVMKSHAAAFRDQGIDPRIVEHELTGGGLRPDLEPIAMHERDAFRAAYVDPDDRRTRGERLASRRGH
jgi:hypothetical protein